MHTHYSFRFRNQLEKDLDVSDSDNDTDKKRDSVGSTTSPIKANVESSEASDETSSSESSSEESNNGNKNDNVAEVNVAEWSLGSFIKPEIKKTSRPNEMTNSMLLAEHGGGIDNGMQKYSDDEKESGSSGTSSSNSPTTNQTHQHDVSPKPASPLTAEENEQQSTVPQQIKLSNKISDGIVSTSSNNYAFEKHFIPSHINGKPKVNTEGVESDDIATVLQEMRPRTPISSLDSDSDNKHSGTVMASTSEHSTLTTKASRRSIKSGRSKTKHLEPDDSSDDDGFSSSNPPKGQKKPNKETQPKGRGRPRKQPKEQQKLSNAQSQPPPSTQPEFTTEQVPKKSTPNRAPPAANNRKGDSKVVGRRRGSRQEAISRETVSTDSSSSDDEDDRNSGHRSSSSQIRRDKKRYISPQKTANHRRPNEKNQIQMSDSSDTE